MACFKYPKLVLHLGPEPLEICKNLQTQIKQKHPKTQNCTLEQNLDSATLPHCLKHLKAGLFYLNQVCKQYELESQKHTMDIK